jgi:phosphatidylglycerophosphate synthase
VRGSRWTAAARRVSELGRAAVEVAGRSGGQAWGGGIRPTPIGLIGSGCLLIADLIWLSRTRPPDWSGLLVWFIGLAVIGVFLAGVANQVSLVRAHLAAFALVYAATPSDLVDLAWVVVLAGVSDLVDGAVARSFRQLSRLGGALDPLVDGVFFGAVAVGLATGEAYPGWLAGVVLARYGLPALAGALLLIGRRRPRLHHTPLGQASTLLIGVLLGGIALFHGLGYPTVQLRWAGEILIPAATLATFINLFWSNRREILGARRGRTSIPGPGASP